MLLFVGLGNPGPKHQGNRHNIGFMAVDRIVHRHGFGPWRQRFHGSVAEGRIGTEKVMALKPQTFMNRSGIAVGEAQSFFKIPPEDVVVFYDELDLAAGKLRVKTGGGAAGHNGIRSLDAHCPPDYRRVRMGIGHPGRDRVLSYVLDDFTADDHKWLDPLLDAVADHAGFLAARDDAGFMTKIALATKPPKPRADPAPAPTDGA